MFNSCAVSGEAKILGENQVVAAFFDGTLGHIHEAGLVGFPSAAKSFGNIGGNRERRFGRKGSSVSVEGSNTTFQPRSVFCPGEKRPGQHCHGGNKSTGSACTPMSHFFHGWGSFIERLFRHPGVGQQAVPTQDPIPEAPSRTSPQYQPELGILDRLIKSRRAEKENWKAQTFESDTRDWEAKRDRTIADHAAKLEAYNRGLADMESAHTRAVEQWEAAREAFLSKQREQHEAIDVNHDSGVLVVNYKLPAPSDIPTLSEVTYVQSSDSFSEKNLLEVNAAKLYDDLIYQVALRTSNDLLEADEVGALTSIVRVCLFCDQSPAALRI